MLSQLPSSNWHRATAATLQAIQDAAWQARPSVLATKLALLDTLGQVEQAASTLSSAMQHWQSGECRLACLPGNPSEHCRARGYLACCNLLCSSLLAVMFSAVPDSPARADALRWITKRLAGIRLRQGALADAAAHYRQLLALDPAALTGELDANTAGACALGCWPPCTSSLQLFAPPRLGCPPPVFTPFARPVQIQECCSSLPTWQLSATPRQLPSCSSRSLLLVALLQLSWTPWRMQT